MIGLFEFDLVLSKILLKANNNQLSFKSSYIKFACAKQTEAVTVGDVPSMLSDLVLQVQVHLLLALNKFIINLFSLKYFAFCTSW